MEMLGMGQGQLIVSNHDDAVPYKLGNSVVSSPDFRQPQAMQSTVNPNACSAFDIFVHIKFEFGDPVR